MSSNTSNLGTYYVKPTYGSEPRIHFKAASLADAQTVAGSLSTLLGMALELQGDGAETTAPNTYTPADRSSGGPQYGEYKAGTVVVDAPDQVFLFNR